MASPPLVAVSVPALPEVSPGQVTEVWHAVDGVRVGVAFARRDAPVLPVGRAGELAFFRSDIARFVTALGKVAYRAEGDDQRIYHFLFGEKTRQSLAPLLEPRRAHRVHPDPDFPIEVSLPLGGNDSDVMGQARDISTTGVGIEVPWEHEASLSKRDVVVLRVRLPGSTTELEFATKIRNRSLGQGAIVYGFEFDLTGVAVDDPRQVAIRSYVSLRTAELERAQERGRRSA
ncbi:MAG: PilZ domain-containing protein [Planctomycetota bacterium]